MALNFPSSPTIGQIYTDVTSGFSYEWDGTVWKSYSPINSNSIKILDDISSSFNGITTSFALTSSLTAVNPPTSQSLLINLGGVIQDPSDDYSISGSNILFSTAPETGLSFSGVFLGNIFNVTLTNIISTDDTSTNTTHYPVLVDSTNAASKISTTKLEFNPSTGILTATAFSGNLTGDVTGNATGLSGTPNITVENITSGNINSSGIITASSFSGNLTGNVTGNATGLSGNPSITVTNATVNGVLSVGGTTVILNAATLQIQDKDIVVGYTTDGLGNDVSNETTANHGGIAIAATTGTPLINIPLQVGVNSNPSTYKQFMWIKQGNYTGFGTDAWISNYPISIGNTETVQTGSRLTVGAGFTIYEGYLDTQDVRVRNFNALGIGTILDTRLQSTSEKSTIVSGTTVSLVYNTGGGNIAIHTNPSADLSLAVTGIPTDSSFDNSVINFSVIVSQTGTARSCTSVTLNGVSKSIRWAGGSLATAIAGVTTSSGYDIYSFTGINTVGSANTTSNYQILGMVNGGFA